MQMKQCRICSTSYPATKEYFVADKKTRDGLMTMCKFCRRAKRKQWDDEHREQVREQKRRSAQKHRDKNLERSRRWLQDPKNVETARARARQHYQDNKEQRRACIARWQSEHKEHIRKQDNERERHKRATNPEYAVYLRTRNQQRRAKRRNADGAFTKEDILLMLKNQKHKCWYCQKSLKKGYHIEHRIPISRGGSNDPSNLVLSCAFCNLSKGAKLPHEWSDRLL